MSPVFTDRYGTGLEIGGEASFAGCARLTVSKPCGIHVEGADFPALAGALYEAAGLPAPVILERPGIAADGDGETGINVFTVRMEPDLRSIGIRYHGANRAIIAPGPARKLASVIAAYADAAQAHQDEPDPAEVEELAAVIRAELYPPSESIGLRPSEADRIAARAALRWFRDEKQQGDAP